MSFHFVILISAARVSKRSGALAPACLLVRYWFYQYCARGKRLCALAPACLREWRWFISTARVSKRLCGGAPACLREWRWLARKNTTDSYTVWLPVVKQWWGNLKGSQRGPRKS